jgi:hypothetical protein
MYYTRYCSSLAENFNQHFYEPHKWLTKWERLGIPTTDETFRELEKILSPLLPNLQDASAKPDVSPFISTFVTDTNRAVFTKEGGSSITPSSPPPTEMAKAEKNAEDVRGSLD